MMKASSKMRNIARVEIIKVKDLSYYYSNREIYIYILINN